MENDQQRLQEKARIRKLVDDEQIQTRMEISRRIVGMMAFGGYFMLLLGAVLVVSIAVKSIFFGKSPPAPGTDEVIGWVMQWYTPELLSLIGAIVLVFVGLRVLTTSGKRVIPDDDRKLLEPLVTEGNRNAIEQYVVLSSLTGFTGTFQKIGFFGLPLATVALTLLFCALSFLKPDFIEFAKLTLGAFIGSFVQRGLEPPKLPSIKWEGK